jgi:glycerol kinase
VFQTHAVITTLNASSDPTHLKVDGGMTNGDPAIEALADVGGFEVGWPEMRESTALGSALLAASAIDLFGSDISQSERLNEVNTARGTSSTRARRNGSTWRLSRLWIIVVWEERCYLSTLIRHFHESDIYPVFAYNEQCRERGKDCFY